MKYSTKQITVSVPVGIYGLIKKLIKPDETVEGFVRESIRVKINQDMQAEMVRLGFVVQPPVNRN